MTGRVGGFLVKSVPNSLVPVLLEHDGLGIPCTPLFVPATSCMFSTHTGIIQVLLPGEGNQLLTLMTAHAIRSDIQIRSAVEV